MIAGIAVNGMGRIGRPILIVDGATGSSPHQPRAAPPISLGGSFVDGTLSIVRTRQVA